MTVSTTACKATASGNGTQTIFTYNFELPAGGSYALIYTDTSGSQTTIASSAYSVTGIGNASGGTFTYPLSGTPIASGTSLTLMRQTPYTQPTSLISQGTYAPSVIEASLDWIVLQVQQLAQQLALALQIPPVDAPGMVTTLPTAARRAGAYATFDSSGNLTATKNPPGAVVPSTAMQPVIQAATTDAALASLGLSPAMRQIVYSASAAGALNSLANGGVISNAPAVSFPPQGNPAATLGSLVLQATTGSPNTREFLGAFNLYSNQGANAGNGAGTADKVALYAGIEGVAGSTDIWSINSLTSMDSGFPAASYALGFELDFNNFAQDRGTAVGWQGFAGATSTGMLVTGSSTHWNTSGISIEGDNSIQWERGVSVVNAGMASFFDWSNATTGFVSYGTHTYGIDLQPMAGASGSTSAIRLGNSMAMVSRNAANSADVPLITLNAYNNVIVGGSGSSGIFINEPNLVPAADNTTSLGLSFLRWQQVWSVNGVIQTSDPSLKTDIAPLPAALPIIDAINPVSFKWIIGGHDVVEQTETQLIHATEERSREVTDHEVRDGKAIPVTRIETHHVHLYDDVPVHDDDGNPVMISIAAKPAVTDATGQITREAQPERSFQKTHRVPRMVERAVPVTKRVSRPGRRDHLGFLASDVKAGFDRHAPGSDYAVYVKDEDGTEHLRPDQLIPVLWKAVQELSAMVSEGKQQTAAFQAELATCKAEIAVVSKAGQG